MNLKNIGENVKKMRLKRGMTQAQLAEKAEISTVHMSHIETGAVAMSLDSLINICNGLETTPDSILLGEFNLHTNRMSALINQYSDNLSSDENRLIVEFAKLLSDMKINR